MLSRDLFPLRALVLATVSLALACKPDSGEDTATDTAATDTAATDTAATDTAATDTAATDTAATDTAATEPTTGNATDTSEPGDTDTTTGNEACVPTDPAAEAGLGFDFGEWPVVGDAFQQTLSIAAKCTVEAATHEAGEVAITLLCSQGDQVDMPIGILGSVPADFALDIDAGLQVQFDAYWQSDGHHVGSGQWFVIRAAADQTVLLAGLDYDSSLSANEALGALTVGEVDGVCEATCEQDCFDEMGTERLAFSFTHDDGPSLQLVDQNRGQLEAGGRKYDVVLDQAVANYCLNCWSDIRWVIGSVPG